MGAKIFDKFLKFFMSFCCLPLLIILSPFGKLYSIFTLTNIFPATNSKLIHSRKVRDVIDQVLEWNRNGRKTQLCTGRPKWKAFSIHSISKDDGSKFTKIQMELDDIIHIDGNNGLLSVEPGMMMGRLTSTLLPLGWTIPVVPELDTLSVGGLVCGAGLESSSHKYGLFSDTCISYEVVLPNGQLITCSKDENSDLFYAIPMSYGTIGFVTAVTIPLIPASKYVKLTYIPVSSAQLVTTLLENDQGEDFVEGIMFGPKKSVILYGKMVNQVDEKRLNLINRWYKPWFYKHVESIANKSNNSTHVEYLPLRDYYHRHSRSYFWEAATSIPYGNHPLFLWLFGWVYPLNFQIVKLLMPQFVIDVFYMKNHVVQDFVLPIKHLQQTLSFLHELIQIYPIWLCPTKIYKKKGMSGLWLEERGTTSGVDESGEMFIDVGVYGDTPKVEDYDAEKTTQMMEAFTIKHQGYQAMYADSYLTREDFSYMFDMKHYYKVRSHYGCEDAFPEVYDKISRHARQF